ITGVPGRRRADFTGTILSSSSLEGDVHWSFSLYEDARDVPLEPARPSAISLSTDRRRHILDGDGTGGGHRHGTGRPRKTEFPADWNDERIISAVAGIAGSWENPTLVELRNSAGETSRVWHLGGVRDGVEIAVRVLPDGAILAAWPMPGPKVAVNSPAGVAPATQGLPTELRVQPRDLRKIRRHLHRCKVEWTTDAQTLRADLVAAGEHAIRAGQVTPRTWKSSRRWMLHARHDNLELTIEVDSAGWIRYVGLATPGQMLGRPEPPKVPDDRVGPQPHTPDTDVQRSLPERALDTLIGWFAPKTVAAAAAPDHEPDSANVGPGVRFPWQTADPDVRAHIVRRGVHVVELSAANIQLLRSAVEELRVWNGPGRAFAVHVDAVDAVDAVAALMDEMGAGYSLLCANPQVVEYAARVRPEVGRAAVAGVESFARTWLAGDDSGDLAAAARDSGANELFLADGLVSAERIAQSAAAGLTMTVWGVADPARMRELIGMAGIAGISSADPYSLRDELIRQNMSVPVEADLGTPRHNLRLAHAGPVGNQSVGIRPSGSDRQEIPPFNPFSYSDAIRPLTEPYDATAIRPDEHARLGRAFVPVRDDAIPRGLVAYSTIAASDPAMRYAPALRELGLDAPPLVDDHHRLVQPDAVVGSSIRYYDADRGIVDAVAVALRSQYRSAGIYVQLNRFLAHSGVAQHEAWWDGVWQDAARQAAVAACRDAVEPLTAHGERGLSDISLGLDRETRTFFADVVPRTGPVWLIQGGYVVRGDHILAFAAVLQPSGERQESTTETSAKPQPASAGPDGRSGRVARPEDPPVTEQERGQARTALRRHPRAAELLSGKYPPDTVSATREWTAASRDWWASLPADSRSAAVRVHPHLIGNLDGVPDTVRDDANRLSIRRDVDRLTAARNLDRRHHGQLENLRQTRDDLAVIESSGGTRVYLRSFDATAFGGVGSAVLVIGNPEAAAVAWHVPGAALGVQGRLLKSFARSAVNHYRATTHADRDADFASVVWLGYHAPPRRDVLRGTFSAANAAAGGHLLARDIAAFAESRRSQDGSTVKLHVVGYSFGTAVVGFAGPRLAPHVESVILLGAPGVGPIHEARGFGIGADNVYVAASADDPITWIGSAERRTPGVVVGRLGVDPAAQRFGARRIPAQYPESGQFTGPQNIHVSYCWFDPQSGGSTEALDGLVRIVTGRGDSIPFAQPRPGTRNALGVPADPERGRLPEASVPRGTGPDVVGLPRDADDCVARAAQAVAALGLADGQIPGADERNASALESAIRAQLTELSLPTEGGRMSEIADQVANAIRRSDADSGPDTAVLVVDDGARIHAVVLADAGGANVVAVFDSLLHGPHSTEEWIGRQPFHWVKQAYVAYFRFGDHGLEAVVEPDAVFSRPGPGRDITGGPDPDPRGQDVHRYGQVPGLPEPTQPAALPLPFTRYFIVGPNSIQWDLDMTAREGGAAPRALEQGLGGRFTRFGSHDDIGRVLVELGEGAAALVVDPTFLRTDPDPSSPDPVGATAHVMHCENNELYVYPLTGRPRSVYLPEGDDEQPSDQQPWALVLRRDGTAVRPVETHDWEFGLPRISVGVIAGELVSEALPPGEVVSPSELTDVPSLTSFLHGHVMPWIPVGHIVLDGIDGDRVVVGGAPMTVQEMLLSSAEIQWVGRAPGFPVLDVEFRSGSPVDSAVAQRIADIAGMTVAVPAPGTAAGWAFIHPEHLHGARGTVRLATDGTLVLHHDDGRAEPIRPEEHLGPMLGAGARKLTFRIYDKVLAVRRAVKDGDSEEFTPAEQLAETLRVSELGLWQVAGIYGLVTVHGRPALLMDYYPGHSKALTHRQNILGKPDQWNLLPPDTKELTDVSRLNERSLETLSGLRGFFKDRFSVTDPQFLIDSDGGVHLSDFGSLFVFRHPRMGNPPDAEDPDVIAEIGRLAGVTQRALNARNARRQAGLDPDLLDLITKILFESREVDEAPNTKPRLAEELYSLDNVRLKGWHNPTLSDKDIEVLAAGIRGLRDDYPQIPLREVTVGQIRRHVGGEKSRTTWRLPSSRHPDPDVVVGLPMATFSGRNPAEWFGEIRRQLRKTSDADVIAISGISDSSAGAGNSDAADWVRAVQACLDDGFERNTSLWRVEPRAVADAARLDLGTVNSVFRGAARVDPKIVRTVLRTAVRVMRAEGLRLDRPATIADIADRAGVAPAVAIAVTTGVTAPPLSPDLVRSVLAESNPGESPAIDVAAELERRVHALLAAEPEVVARVRAAASRIAAGELDDWLSHDLQLLSGPESGDADATLPVGLDVVGVPTGGVDDMEQMAAAGVRTIEVDVALSADGVAMAFVDPDGSRPDVPASLAGMSAREAVVDEVGVHLSNLGVRAVELGVALQVRWFPVAGGFGPEVLVTATMTALEATGARYRVSGEGAPLLQAARRLLNPAIVIDAEIRSVKSQREIRRWQRDLRGLGIRAVSVSTRDVGRYEGLGAVILRDDGGRAAVAAALDAQPTVMGVVTGDVVAARAVGAEQDVRDRHYVSKFGEAERAELRAWLMRRLRGRPDHDVEGVVATVQAMAANTIGSDHVPLALITFTEAGGAPRIDVYDRGSAKPDWADTPEPDWSTVDRHGVVHFLQERHWIRSVWVALEPRPQYEPGASTATLSLPRLAQVAVVNAVRAHEHPTSDQGPELDGSAPQAASVAHEQSWAGRTLNTVIDWFAPKATGSAAPPPPRERGIMNKPDHVISAQTLQMACEDAGLETALATTNAWFDDIPSAAIPVARLLSREFLSHIALTFTGEAEVVMAWTAHYGGQRAYVGVLLDNPVHSLSPEQRPLPNGTSVDTKLRLMAMMSHGYGVADLTYRDPHRHKGKRTAFWFDVRLDQPISDDAEPATDRLPATSVAESSAERPDGIGLTIRVMRPDEDLTIVQRIDAICLGDIPAPSPVFHSWAEGGYLFVAELDGHAVGYASAVRGRTGTAHIQGLAVIPGYRGHRIGWNLWNFSQKRLLADGVTRFVAVCKVDNVLMHRIYQQAGYQLEGVAPAYYGEDGDRLVWSWNAADPVRAAGGVAPAPIEVKSAPVLDTAALGRIDPHGPPIRHHAAPDGTIVTSPHEPDFAALRRIDRSIGDWLLRQWHEQGYLLVASRDSKPVGYVVAGVDIDDSVAKLVHLATADPGDLAVSETLLRAAARQLNEDGFRRFVFPDFDARHGWLWSRET
ncbi:MAG: GNAT family N-acetyltransferase, partial [Mycobacteriaceae bacterium]|nr:GNAT family N-acetyltransferase [Mycobacteriaceae bacterium]